MEQYPYEIEKKPTKELTFSNFYIDTGKEKFYIKNETINEIFDKCAEYFSELAVEEIKADFKEYKKIKLKEKTKLEEELEQIEKKLKEKLPTFKERLKNKIIEKLNGKSGDLKKILESFFVIHYGFSYISEYEEVIKEVYEDEKVKFSENIDDFEVLPVEHMFSICKASWNLTEYKPRENSAKFKLTYEFTEAPEEYLNRKLEIYFEAEKIPEYKKEVNEENTHKDENTKD